MTDQQLQEMWERDEVDTGYGYVCFVTGFVLGCFLTVVCLLVLFP